MPRAIGALRRISVPSGDRDSGETGQPLIEQAAKLVADEESLGFIPFCEPVDDRGLADVHRKNRVRKPTQDGRKLLRYALGRLPQGAGPLAGASAPVPL